MLAFGDGSGCNCKLIRHCRGGGSGRHDRLVSSGCRFFLHGV